MSSGHYHLLELAIATDVTDPRRIMPPIGPSHRRILDVGCGAGQTLIASRFDAGVVACGVDVDLGALWLGRSLDRRLRLVCARGETLPFRPASFDLVISRVAIPYMHVQRALGEMWRVMKAGGELWIVLHPLAFVLRHLRQGALGLRPRACAYQLYVLASGLALHLSGRQFPWLAGTYESFQTTRAISRALRRAGFGEIRVHRDRFFIATARRPGRAGAA
jgi:ubiquinone/menaquinone biosynthesis C-methylase UbiE